MKFNEVIDPKGICADVSRIGHWGNGEVSILIDHSDQIDAMDIIQQAFDTQNAE